MPDALVATTAHAQGKYLALAALLNREWIPRKPPEKIVRLVYDLATIQSYVSNPVDVTRPHA